MAELTLSYATGIADLLKCGICYEQYDSSERRPRTLPCHHFFCTSCIGNNIQASFHQCPSCRHRIEIISVSTLPANTLMEDLLHSLEGLDISQHVLNEDFSAGFCPDHGHCKLYFKCKNHNVNVCRDCTVIAHPTGVCELISFKDDLKEKIKVHQIKVKNQISSLNDMMAVLQTDLDNEKGENIKLKCELRELKEKVNTKLKDIEKSESKINVYNERMQDIEKQQPPLHTLKSRLETTDRAIEINALCEEAEKNYIESKKLLSKLQKDLPIKLSPTSSNKAHETTPEVYMNLVKGDEVIGTVYIKPNNDTYGKMFRDIMTGYSGCSVLGKTRYFQNLNLWCTMHNLSELSCVCESLFSFPMYMEEKLKPGGVYLDHSKFVMIAPSNFSFANGTRFQVGTVTRGMDVVDAACCNDVSIVETGLSPEI